MVEPHCAAHHRAHTAAEGGQDVDQGVQEPVQGGTEFEQPLSAFGIEGIFVLQVEIFQQGVDMIDEVVQPRLVIGLAEINSFSCSSFLQSLPLVRMKLRKKRGEDLFNITEH